MAGRRLGFVGVGRMGGPMAGRLIDAGYALTVHDASDAATAALAARGAEPAASPEAVAAAAEIVLTSLPTPEIVERVALGERGLASGSRIRVLIDLSTTGPRMAAAIAARLAERRIMAVDAPVSGGLAGARGGTLAVMASCARELFAEVRPILEIFGKVFLVGDRPGMGQVMKLANNLLSGAAMAISSEAVVMGVKAGLDPRVMIDVINAGSGRNSAIQDKFPKAVLPRSFDFGFALDLLYKDVKLCLEEAEALGVPMIVGSAVRQLLAIAKATQPAGADMTAVARSVEEWAGVEVKG